MDQQINKQLQNPKANDHLRKELHSLYKIFLELAIIEFLEAELYNHSINNMPLTKSFLFILLISCSMKSCKSKQSNPLILLYAS
ncbi:hypothetical protein RHMOL_Rhmol06G0208800 [Rhododendron molle]|uniref:Uncharacterized protein n=1 Tax=Rhododendron molle TaxID=49168 RepID=A0ACC0NGV2_RHOML|nr:hypothetical protein RHMOL_Rhmol06G0208800 [Rhododendron molle]